MNFILCDSEFLLGKVTVSYALLVRYILSFVGNILFVEIRRVKSLN